jgi:hypothetical protein
MIDTYMDRVDAATGNWRIQRDNSVQQLYDHPCYYNGSLYATIIDRTVAEARDSLTGVIDRAVHQHRRELRLGIKMGHLGSLFQASGHRK